MEQQKENEQQKRFEAAVCFARMYGIKETLESLEFKDNKEVVALALQWADEYLKAGCPDDIAAFFEEAFNKEKGDK